MALQMILDINNETRHLHNRIALLVADWPGQLFIRKALTHLQKSDSQYSIPAEINSFIPILDNRNHCELKDTFEKIKTHSYTPLLLNLLTEKTSLFLIDYFYDIFKNRGKEETVDSKCLPTGYNANIPSSPNECGYC
ncbi:15633_t:CDS:2 [Funneliformis geosporum]|uniref:15633_t:CDS:1 n=1 Tax=Funneliformis geosporum TaxID=1117311 RepID=A0A9W4SY04_9GLOM|nr:15633_t:CDS:2 [Funneliformis geosporum]